MRKLLWRNSTRIIIFVLLIALADLNPLELFVILSFISGFSEDRNFNFGEGILFHGRIVVF